jgi:26S proteasome regulatory subunit T1
VCTEAGMFAIRARRKVATEKDFLEAVNKVIKSYAKVSISSLKGLFASSIEN